ncbi:MAG: hypothetical protein QOD13_3631, partial [Thermoleophilaceae bacterium]|nr:hypothetical protein [Thermoleophilaceae bacterium]
MAVKPTRAVPGIETHICVWQTGHDLLRAGHEVHVVRAAGTPCSSRGSRP